MCSLCTLLVIMTACHSTGPRGVTVCDVPCRCLRLCPRCRFRSRTAARGHCASNKQLFTCRRKSSSSVDVDDGNEGNEGDEGDEGGRRRSAGGRGNEGDEGDEGNEGNEGDEGNEGNEGDEGDEGGEGSRGGTSGRNGGASMQYIYEYADGTTVEEGPEIFAMYDMPLGMLDEDEEYGSIAGDEGVERTEGNAGRRRAGRYGRA